MAAPSEKLVIFVKAPRPGLVKTRLAQAIGAEAACDAYRMLAQTLFDRLKGLQNVELHFDPADAVSEIEPWLNAGWRAIPQGSGDLGQRLAHAFEDAFETGARRVVIIGSDCPAITIADIQTAWAGLAEHDLVLGPATDGGYWLIGLTRPQPALFQQIAWSSATVLRETQIAAQTAHLRVKLLRQLADVDTGSDWASFLAEYREPGPVSRFQPAP